MQAEAQVLQARTYPENILPALQTVRFVCPLCHGELQVLNESYECEECKKEYSLHGGIPDFRVFPDPYLNFQQDKERTDIVLAGLNKLNLKDLLEYYWSFSDITPEDLRKKFISSVMRGEERARHTLKIFENGTFKKPVAGKKVLEIGSGTGNFLAVAAGHYAQVTGIDIAMRWLHVSRRRFMDKGLPVPPLVCCCAEYLPFPNDSFDLVTMTSTLEFVKDQAKALSECSRTLKDDGALYINSVNRFALTRDPYAYLWGVGILPRSLQEKYVRWRKDATYKTKTLSYNELNRLGRSEFSSIEFALPDIESSVLQQFSAITKLQVYIYRFLKNLPVFSLVFKHVGPGWDVLLRNPSLQK